MDYKPLVTVSEASNIVEITKCKLPTSLKAKGFPCSQQNMKKLQWHTEKIKLSNIIDNPLNPRKINDFGLKALENSIDKFNLVTLPVVDYINKDGKYLIISGHQRIAILRAKGIEEVECRVPNRPLSEMELKEYTLIENTHAGIFDVEILDLEYSDVISDFEFQLPILDSPNNSEVLDEENEVIEEEKENKTNVIAIQLTDTEMIRWLEAKEKLNEKTDKKALFVLLNKFS